MEVMWPYNGAERPNFNVNWDKRVNAMQTYLNDHALCLKGVIHLAENGGDIFILIEGLCYQ